MIDPQALGCDALTSKVYEKHAAGACTSAIARETGVDARCVRAYIVSVWSIDRAAAMPGRKGSLRGA